MKCPILVNNFHYTLHQAFSVYGGLNLQCSEEIRSSLEDALKHLPGSSGAFLSFAGPTVALMELTVQGVDEVDSDHIGLPFSIVTCHMSTPTSLPPDTERPGTPSEDTDVGSCSYKSCQSSPDVDSPCVSPSASPAITISEEE